MRLRLAVGGAAGIAGFLPGTLLFLALAGCGGAGPATTSGTSPGTGQSVQQQARVVWLDYARCVRAHGFPNFPDPQVDSRGRASFGNRTQAKSIALQVQGSCGSILSRLPAAAQGRTPVTAAQLRQEVLFAGCLRRHGLPDFPDPRPDGTFRLAGTPYASMGKTEPVLSALQACRSYDTFGGIKLS